MVTFDLGVEMTSALLSEDLGGLAAGSFTAS